jgi:outer membrane lipoprotein SlyB
MSIISLKHYFKDAVTAVPLFAAKAKAKILQSANEINGFQPGLILGTLSSTIGALTGCCVGYTAGSLLLDSTWAPHTTSLGAATGSYIGSKLAKFVCDLSNHPQSELRLGKNAGNGASASQLITMPFTLAQYGSKISIATALAITHFRNQIARGAVWAADAAKESFALAQGLNVLADIRHIQDTNEQRRDRGDLHGWSHEVDQLILEYARPII